ncbi:hypothetical protein ALP29_201426 [Pseudomonas syringae pv. avii]|uniref:Uncharacterized protein n=1 Tax=Pseudomonas syringae pv. avii TaxID=663959 RepID=A0A3M5VT45_PSESX|nr:hypothetical protein ALP29_201426 [Pseudomonas syringae pv. avii]
MPSVIDQLERRDDLLHAAGLAYLAVVEANEVRRFGVVSQGEVFGRADGSLEHRDQRLELLLVRHQASPPNTSTLANTHAGEA